MTEIVKSLEEFLETYILDTAIKSIVFDNLKAKWIVNYNYEVAPDEFDSAQELVDFLEGDQGNN